MRCLPALLLLVSLAAQAAPKPEPLVTPNVPQPRQGGDTMETAVAIAQLPFSSSGTTTGYADDYDEVCPYSGSTSPDVVYAYETGDMPVFCEYVEIDLYGSTYDTKLYVYDEDLQLVACNDDFYSDYVSKLESVPFRENETYYIVIDGYGGDHGNYVINIYEYECCYVFCPPGFLAEGEPPLQDDVPDTFNSGCDGDSVTPPILPLPVLDNGTVDLCGTHGWTTVGGEVRGDVDWFSLVIGATGTVEGLFEDNLHALVQVVTPGGCDGIQVQQTIDVNPCHLQELNLTGQPGDEVWLRLETLGTPGCGGYTPQEWEYKLELSGLQQTVAVEPRSWSTVKGMFGGPDPD